MRAVTGDLRGRGDLREGMEKIELDGKAEMTASAADDVVLVARSDLKGVKLALDDSTGMDGIASPDDVAAECSCPRTPERDNDDIEMVFVSEFPVYFAGKRGVGIEVEVFGQINWIGIALGADGAGGVGIKPTGVEADFVLIEFLLLLAVQGYGKNQEQERCDQAYPPKKPVHQVCCSLE